MSESVKVCITTRHGPASYARSTRATALGFAAAAGAFAIGRSDLASEHVFVGLFCIAVYWLGTLVALSGTELLAIVTKYGFVVGTAIPGILLLGLFIYWVLAGHPLGWETTTNSAVSPGTHRRAGSRTSKGLSHSRSSVRSCCCSPASRSKLSTSRR
jgi:amino acid transporter